MNTDYSYCSGVTCSIRKSCKRYLPDPPDTRLQWVWPAYNPETDKCKYGAQNEAYMSRSAEKWVRGLCFNELGVSG